MSISTYQPQLSLVFMGLAADTKPAISQSAPVGSRFIETDTLKVFLLMNTGTWAQIGVMAITAVPFASPI